MHYCGMCGTQLAQMCLACGFADPVAYRYCGQCGARLVEETGSVVEAERPAALLPGHVDVAITLPMSADELPIPLIPTTIQLEGERRVVTVVMTDMTSSMNLLDKLGTEAWVELMNRVFHILEAGVFRFGGEGSQVRGDGLIALFGVTEGDEAAAQPALLSAP